MTNAEISTIQVIRTALGRIYVCSAAFLRPGPEGMASWALLLGNVVYYTLPTREFLYISRHES